MERTQPSAQHHWWPYAALLLLGALVWGHTLQFQFVWDDRQFIAENESLRSWSGLPAVLGTRAGQSSLPEHFCLYRPVRTVAYAALFALGGKPVPQPWVFHLANVLGHTLVALLLYRTTLLLMGVSETIEARPARWAAFLAAAGFLVHPAGSEVVCWAKSFDDILAAIFCLAALSQVLAWRENSPGRLWAAVALFLLALYAKESAAPFPLVALAALHFILRRPIWQSLRLSAGFFLALLVFLVHRHFVLGQTSQSAPVSGSYGQTVLDTVPCLFTYARLALGFPPFSVFYLHLEKGRALGSMPVLLGLACLALGAVGAFAALRSARWRAAGLGLLWAGVFFLPVSNLVPMMQLMADRFLYLPLIGFLMASAVCIVRWRYRLSAAIGAASVIAVWAGVSWERSWVWRDDLTLFVDAALNHPPHPVIENNAADAILNLPSVRKIVRGGDGQEPSKSDIASALGILTEAHDVFPGNGPLANALGVVSIVAGRMDLAIASFQRALEIAPQNSRYAVNLGSALMTVNRPADAARLLARVAPLLGNDVPYLRVYAAALLSANDLGTGETIVSRLKVLDPARAAEYDGWLTRARAATKNDALPGAAKAP